MGTITHGFSRYPYRLKRVPLAAVVLAAGLVFSACTGGGSGGGVTLHIVGFAVPEAANKAIAAQWTTEAGRSVRFVTAYGASGDQSRAVVNGLPADYVHFSVATDVTRLVDAGLVDEDWDDGPTKGIVSSSIIVFAVRPGNPKGIRDWDDLIRPGVGIVTPNPASSGAARWSALAAWGQVIEASGTEEDAAGYMARLFANVVSLPNSGRDATTSFLSGTGDVLLTYENEAILATQHGEAIDWVYPGTTILIENPGAVLRDASPQATQWLDFVLGPVGQRQFALNGFRPVIDGVDTSGVEGAKDPDDPFPTPRHLLTVADDFESWSALSRRFFDENRGIIVKIIADSGKAA